MAPLDRGGVESAVVDFLNQANAILFAGAGVGARAGLPLWDEFMQSLADVAGEYEGGLAEAMRVRIREGEYAEAGSLFMKCRMPAGEKDRAKSRRFSGGDWRRLKALVSLPFAGIVTTNYDGALHNAWLNLGTTGRPREMPDFVELDGELLRRAPYLTRFFIARIHGRVDAPDTMVISSEQYEDVLRNDAYVGFLYHLLTRRALLFMGFSFIDPAIAAVLKLIDLKGVADLLPTHLALVPEGSDGLAAALADRNIRAVEYSESEWGHGVLWSGIAEAAKALSGRPQGLTIGPILSAPSSLEGTRKALAACYVQSTMEGHLPALRDIVLAGVVCAAVSEGGSAGVTEEELAERLARCLPLRPDQVPGLIKEPLEYVLSQGKCRREEGRIIAGEVEDRLGPAMAVLAEGVKNRVLLRRAGLTRRRTELAKDFDSVMRIVLEDAVLMRGWELGAHFAGGMSTIERFDSIRAIVDRHSEGIGGDVASDLTDACIDMMQRPTDEEGGILAELGRLAFGIDVVFQLGRVALLNPEYLPSRIYLDASVALPFVVEGHPLRPVYADAISRWRSTIDESGERSSLMIGLPFVREMVEHRRLAFELVEEQGLEDVERLTRYVLFRGAQYVNVYVGAFSTWVASGKGVGFSEWMNDYAPYSSIAELRDWLEVNGIEVVSLDAPGEQRGEDIYEALSLAYERDPGSQWNPKPAVLIRHEALQLARLCDELARNRRVVFVSADRRLRRLAGGPRFGEVGGAIVSHVGLVQLIDLLIGANADPRALSRLFWGVHSLDEKEALREYLTNLALRKLEETTTLTLPEIVDKVVERASAQAASEGIRLLDERRVEDVARSGAFLDRVEDEFFELVREAVEKRKAGEAELREMAIGKESGKPAPGGVTRHKGTRRRGRGKKR
jgi:hypothetical protein